jgi:hypothetical protein
MNPSKIAKIGNFAPNLHLSLTISKSKANCNIINKNSISPQRAGFPNGSEPIFPTFSPGFQKFRPKFQRRDPER